MFKTFNLQLPRSISWIIGYVVGLTTLFVALPVHAVGVAPAILDMKTTAGRVVEQTVTIVNNERSTRTFQFKKENFTPSDEPGVAVFDGGTGDEFPQWISLSPDVLTLSSGERGSVELSVAVPVGATPGDYYGVVFVGSSQTQVAAQTALLIFLTVEGELDYGVEIASVDIGQLSRSRLYGEAELRVQNSGSVYFKPAGEVVLNPLIGKRRVLSSNPGDLRILPGQSRSWTVRWGEEISLAFLPSLLGELRWFALGPVEVAIEVVAQEGVSDEVSSRFWVFPWRTGLILLGVLILYVIFRKWMMSRRS